MGWNASLTFQPWRLAFSLWSSYKINGFYAFCWPYHKPFLNPTIIFIHPHCPGWDSESRASFFHVGHKPVPTALAAGHCPAYSTQRLLLPGAIRPSAHPTPSRLCFAKHLAIIMTAKQQNRWMLKWLELIKNKQILMHTPVLNPVDNVWCVTWQTAWWCMYVW